MNKFYNIQNEIDILKGDIGVRFSLDADIEKAEMNGGLWGNSSRFVSQAIHCVLCGMLEEAGSLINKSEKWMARAIEIGEIRPRFGEASGRLHHRLYSVIRWLCRNVHEQRSLDIWLAGILGYFNSQTEVDSFELGLSAVTFVDAGALNDYLKLAAPEGIDAVKCSGANEKQMALTLAIQALAHKFTEEDVRMAVKKFLDNHVGKWLNDGHAVRAAEWMKVIYWKRGESGLSPFEAVRKCLDHVKTSNG